MATNQKIGIYAGTFDPVTKGHLDLIKRASFLVDTLIIGVAPSRHKAPLFTQDERATILSTDIENLHGKGCTIHVRPFEGLLVDFARKSEATCIIRGLRAVSDFEYEFQMTGMNAKLDPSIETIFLMAGDKWQFVSSSFIKEIASLGGDITQFVTPNVKAELQKKFKSEISQ